MSTDFENIRAKVARAREHLKSFEDEVGAYFQTCGAIMDIEVNPQSYQMSLYLSVEKEPPVRLSVIVGDCVHNARSALDNLICALARIEQSDSSCSGRQYPAFTDLKDYMGARTKILKGVPEQAKRLIDELNPCASSDDSIPAKMHAVAILNTLSNRDKHRAPHLAAAYSRETTFVAQLPQGPYVLKLTGALYANTHMEIPFQAGLIKHRDRLQGNPLFNIHFRDKTMFGDEPVLSLLTFCLDFIEDVILPSFQPFFDKRS